MQKIDQEIAVWMSSLIVVLMNNLNRSWSKNKIQDVIQLFRKFLAAVNYK